MRRLLSAIEMLAGFALALVAGLIFLTAALRYGLSTSLPDGFDIARYLQGIALMWGMSVATYRSGHIRVDLVWELSGERIRRAIDIFAAFVTAAFFCVFAWALLDSLGGRIRSNELTADMRIVVWPFYLTAILGVVATALVSLVVLFRTFQPTDGHAHG